MPITPSVLTWAIREAGYPRDEDAAPDLGVSPDVLRAWQDGESQPNLTQFRKLSAVLRRTPSTFLLPAPPDVPQPQVSFRHPPGVSRRAPNRDERLHLREAIRLQEVAHWIAREEEQPSTIPRLDTEQPPEEAAGIARAALAPHLSTTQEAFSTPSRAFDAWRSAIESLGTLVFLFPMGEDSAQGFSLEDDFAPVVAVNTFWRDQARTYTLCHEFGHLMTGTSSLCLEHDGLRSVRPSDNVERWCEQFAAALLLPAVAVTELIQRRFRLSDDARVTSLDVPRAIANEFQVSLRAATIRLIELGMASWSLYSDIEPARERNRGFGSGGEGQDRDQRRHDRYGDRTFRLFVRALRTDLLGRSAVLDYLDITDRGLSKAQQSFPQAG